MYKTLSFIRMNQQFIAIINFNSMLLCEMRLYMMNKKTFDIFEESIVCYGVYNIHYYAQCF
jgi:hypothetical protein